ncbi:LSU ribosomal protein L9P [Nitzschia inconspicua]|uniref:LSU ribosomal protein L9P n=1 Tax=Nitzschia inconspicua TaxID=303405 RepID=A0A9K3LZE7_9STRA|nr:LSU ribosomal protein L9P [Nitzschia inconspicua]
MSCRLISSAFGQSFRSGRHVAAAHQSHQLTFVRFGHSVRLIALQDLPFGKAYKGDVLTVKSGYARNYLIPKKMALYATPQNFERLKMVDPDVETEEQRIARLQRESSMSAGEEKYLKEADLLKKYLRNKMLKLWRNVDPNSIDVLHPGMVTAEHLREKLSKQLKIDLDDSENIHIFSSEVDGTSNTLQPMVFAELTDKQIQSMVEEYKPHDGPCSIEIKRLGEYLAKISLKGGYSVPLRFVVLQR